MYINKFTSNTFSKLDLIIEQPYEIIKSGFNEIISLTFLSKFISPLFKKIVFELSIVSSQYFLKIQFQIYFFLQDVFFKLLFSC